MSAIKAEYINFKNVLSRKAFQIILEVPAEAAPEVLKTLGMPTAHESKWVGVALLKEEQTILDAG